jgi:hypothetical protein
VTEQTSRGSPGLARPGRRNDELLALIGGEVDGYRSPLRADINDPQGGIPPERITIMADPRAVVLWSNTFVPFGAGMVS